MLVDWCVSVYYIVYSLRIDVDDAHESVGVVFPIKSQRNPVIRTNVKFFMIHEKIKTQKKKNINTIFARATAVDIEILVILMMFFPDAILQACAAV